VLVDEPDSFEEEWRRKPESTRRDRAATVRTPSSGVFSSEAAFHDSLGRRLGAALGYVSPKRHALKARFNG
jgi:hypothetical protein